jgi:predicted TPR repeat methyltransferase
MNTQTTHPDAQQDQVDNVHSTANEFPFTLYNHKSRQTKLAKDKADYDNLVKAGFVEEPLEPQDPDALTADEVKTLQSLLAKAAKALEKLGKVSQSDEKNNDEGHSAAGQKEGAARRK